MSEVYQDPEYRQLYAGCLANCAERTGWAALKDFLTERGEPEVVAADEQVAVRIGNWDVWRFGRGIGSGIGSGSGRGIGSGSGSGIGRGRGSGSGRGSGIGSGSGSGSGRGRGSGSGRGSGIGRGRGSGSGRDIGSGSGSGSGRGRGSGSYYEGTQMEVGQAYLIHAGDWHTFVGRVVRQLGPVTYELSHVSKVKETNNGDCWEQLAAGDAKLRKAASYAHFKGLCVLPLSIFACPWEGALPQELEARA